MPKPRVERTPIEVVHRSTNLRTGRTEIWEAVSLDGVWSYERTEEPRTPWIVKHVPSGRWYYDTSLPKARAATASGRAEAYLDALDRERARDAARNTAA